MSLVCQYVYICSFCAKGDFFLCFSLPWKSYSPFTTNSTLTIQWAQAKYSDFPWSLGIKKCNIFRRNPNPRDVHLKVNIDPVFCFVMSLRVFPY